MPAQRVEYVPRPYVSSHRRDTYGEGRLSDLIRLSGQQQAEAELRRGDIQAQMWANVGKSISDSIYGWQESKDKERKRIEETKLKNQQFEANELQIKEAKAASAAREQATRDTSVLGSALTMDLDPDAIEEQLTTKGYSHLVPAFRKSWNDSETAQAARQKARMELDAAEADYFGSLAAGVKASNYDVGAVQIALSKAKRDGYDGADELLAQIQQRPELVTQLVDGLIARSPRQREEARKDQELAVKRTSEERQLKTLEGTIADRAADNTRADRQFGETVRHNQAMEQRPTAGATQRYSRAPVTVNGVEIQANYDAKTGKYHHPDTDEVLQGVTPAPTADMKNKSEGRKFVSRSIDAIEKLSQKVITKRGVAQRALATGRSVEAALGNDPEYRTYQDARKALAGNLAVAQQGSRPSDTDIIQIWLPMVPDVFRDTDESAAMKWDLIKEMSLPGSPSRNTAQPGGAPGGPVRMIAPDGRPLEIPADKVEEAIRRGARRAP